MVAEPKDLTKQDYELIRRLEKAGIAIEKRLFTLEDMLVKYDDIQEEYGTVMATLAWGMSTWISPLARRVNRTSPSMATDVPKKKLPLISPENGEPTSFILAFISEWPVLYITGLPPAPRPRVSFWPSWVRFWAADCSSAWASVLSTR